MSEQSDLIGRLEAVQFLASVRWAYGSATGRTLDDYSEDAGYDAAWLGQTRHTLFRDRLDRVTSCGRYALQADADENSGIDLVHAELPERDIVSMPQLPRDLVRRADLNLSPGWVVDNVRVLLASCPVGKVDNLPWPQKSPTKQRVASQANPDPGPTLFDLMPSEEVSGLLALGEGSVDMDTYVIAHTLDPVSQRRELVLGRPRMNRGGGQAWYWRENLLLVPTDPGARRPEMPAAAAVDKVPDAAVRLRSRSAKPASAADAS